MSASIHRPVRFAFVGVVNTLSGLVVIYALKWTLNADDFAANLIGYGVGLVVSLTLNSRWTFGYRGPLSGVAVRFIAVVVVAYVANWVVVRAFLAHGLDSYFSQALGVAPYAVISYFGMKHLVYARVDARE